MNSSLLKQPMVPALFFSLALHAFVLFGIGFKLPSPGNYIHALQPFQVTLINSHSDSMPDQADALAQANLNGGGNTAKDLHAKNPFPLLDDGKQFTPEQSAQHLQSLEQEARRLMVQIKSMHSVARNKDIKRDQPSTKGEDLVQRSLEIARLEAQVDKDYQAYEKLPRRRFIGARTREYRFAQYVEDWRIKVERIGNLNYPPAVSRSKTHGSLVMTVSIRSDGSLDGVEIDRSSGKPILDAAALRIIKLAAPFSAFPPNIRKDTDILSITRTWTFTDANNLSGED